MRVFFVGSRSPVFEAMYALGMQFAKIMAVDGSALQRHVECHGIAFETLTRKAQLLNAIGCTPFDLLVSNGCPCILPVSCLRKPGQQFVNVHPSLLPNLKGRHPVNGAVLFNQSTGATCHLMDDGIDTGPAIARVHVDAGHGVDLGLLYRLAFMAEADAFRIAFTRNFVPGSDELDHLAHGRLYFSRTPDSMRIRLDDPLDLTVRRVAAFAVPGQLARLVCNCKEWKVARAERVESRYLATRFRDVPAGTLVIRYDDSLVVKLKDGYLRLSGVTGDLAPLQEGARLTDNTMETVQC